jgi:hypothetical protein
MTENYEKDFVPHKQALALKELGVVILWIHF